ncbi:MAG: pantoate--beta-alanine ligase, partial [Fimbriimonadales bacterium]
RLTTEKRQIAPTLFEEMQDAATLLQLHHAIATVEKRSIAKLEAKGFKVDYFSVVNANTMQKADKLEGELRLVVAAWLGNVRLIDNVAV